MAKKETLVVQSKVKALAKKNKMRMSADAVGALSCQVETMIKGAAVRAKANRRSTIKAQDV